MHNNCNHPNYQGDRSRCGGSQGSQGRQSFDAYEVGTNFFTVLLWTKETKPYFYRHDNKTFYPSATDEASIAPLKRMGLQQCNQKTGGGCEYEESYVNVCIAVAYNSAEKFSTWKYEDAKSCRYAKSEAMAACKRNSKTQPKACNLIATSRYPGFWN
ncbi:DUF4189 domain-containing protein [Paralysiella testudinis]|uniref:DUF4189 domain-containing protein n=1 Tax=Paralysiella testudinis TaxID=2809020 RepID=A0A892ZK43_9NEIS|nr:DUF4189 domain-containing protein [Paralysiella testudinis]QRQ82177.1 DUF4189 domain-containing protein [Paralysiella testudinis]